MTDVATLLFLWSGMFFIFLATIGLLRMPDLLCRSQTTTMAATFGKIGIFTAAALAIPEGEGLSRGCLAVLFLFLTSPVGAHMITRAAYLRGVPLHSKTINDDPSQRL